MILLILQKGRINKKSSFWESELSILQRLNLQSDSLPITLLDLSNLGQSEAHNNYNRIKVSLQILEVIFFQDGTYINKNRS